VVITLKALPEDELWLSGGLVVDRREARRRQADDDVFAAHFDVESIGWCRVHAGPQGRRLCGTKRLVHVSLENEPRPQGAGARGPKSIDWGGGATRNTLQKTDDAPTGPAWGGQRQIGDGPLSFQWPGGVFFKWINDPRTVHLLAARR
jgi:hypothetical protein